MTSFIAEPVPLGVDPILAEYLDRQFQALNIVTWESWQAPIFNELPERTPIGAIIYLQEPEAPLEAGFYGCVENDQGDGEWMQFQLTKPQP